MDAFLISQYRPPSVKAVASLPHSSRFRAHSFAWRRAADLAVEVHRTASKGTVLQAGLAGSLQEAALRIAAELSLAALETGTASGRRRLLMALRAIAVLDSHVRIALELLPYEKSRLHEHLRAAKVLHCMVSALAVRLEKGRHTSP